MAKLINILAMSFGGGLVLGAGIRALEAKPGKKQSDRDGRSDSVAAPSKRLIARIDMLEARLANLEADPASVSDPTDRPDPVLPGSANISPGSPVLSAIDARLNAYEAEADQILSRLTKIEKNVSRAHENNEKLGIELKDWAASDISRQIVEVESRLALSLEAERRQTLETVVEGVHLRVAERVSKLEKEVVGQAAAMVELRECSVKTEQSIQRLLVGIDRLVSSQNEGKPGSNVEIPRSSPGDAASHAGNTGRASDALPRRRWGLFG